MKNNGGQVKRFTKVELFDESPGAKIFFTTDGSPPELHLDSAKVCFIFHCSLSEL